MDDRRDDVTRLRDAYRRWDASKGTDVTMWTELFADDARLRSLAAGRPGLEFTLDCHSTQDVARYFRGLEQDWTMIGCEKSVLIHEHFYKSKPPRLEMCPRKLTGEPVAEKTLLKCCLLETTTEFKDDLAVVPWGAELRMVEDALRWLSQGVMYA